MVSIPRIQQLPLFVFSRVCTKCGFEKSLDEFGNQEGGLYGKRAACKKCILAQDRERRLHPKVKPVPRPGYKFCTACGLEKPLEEFHAHKRGFAGRDPHCKECKKDETHARRSTPEYRTYDRDKHRKHKAYYAAHYIETKEVHRERGRKWRKANPERGRNANLRRKAHKLNAVVEPVDYKAILERDGYHCYICGKPIDPTAKRFNSAALTFDHRIPLQPRPGEPQGSHTEENIHPAHNACNVRKGNIPFEQLTPWQRRGV